MSDTPTAREAGDPADDARAEGGRTPTRPGSGRFRAAPPEVRFPDLGGLRIALFSGNYNYTHDGANQALNRLVGHLLEAGAKVRVYSPTSSRPAFPPMGELVSVPSVPLPARAEYRVALPLPKRLRADIRDFRPDLVHLSAPDLLGYQAQKLGRRLGVPVIASLHTRFETYLSYYGLDFLRPAAERYLARFYSGCDTVLAPNGPMRDLLNAQCPKTPIAIWSRGIDRQLFSPARRSLEWRRSVGIADDERVVVFLGRLVMEKGLDVLAETAHILSRETKGARFLIIGDGPAGPWLRKHLPDAIYTGFLGQPQLGEALASADIFFNPSRTETFGNVTLEAMASGLAVVLPAVPSTSELIASGEYGLMLQDQSAGAYAEALGRLIRDPALHARLVDAALLRSAAYDWRACSMAVMQAYAEVGRRAAQTQAA